MEVKGGKEMNLESAKQTFQSGNIDEIFQYALTLCQESYDVETSFDADKYFIEGEFPILINKVGKYLYVVFRGTKNDFSGIYSSMESISNMIYDLSTWNGSGRNQNIKDFENLSRVLTKETASVQAHTGFLQVLDKYYNELRNEIDKYSSSVNSIIFSGHSAGGALSTLAYYVYQNDTATKNKIKVDYCINFGSPRVFIDNFNTINLFNETCPNTFRCFNKNDIVTYLPFHKSIAGIDLNVASGFIHVGTPVCLDDDLQINSLNNLILEVMKGNKDKFNGIFENYTLEEIESNKLIQFIQSDEYLSLMAGSLFTCFKGVATNPDLTQEMIKEYGKRLHDESGKLLTYALKCQLVKPFLLDDILLKNKLSPDEDKQDITIAGIGASVLGYNKIAVKAHDLKLYESNLDIRLQREAQTDTPFLAPLKVSKTDFQSGKTIIQSGKSKMEKEPPITLEDLIQIDIDKGYIMGITFDGEPGNLIIVQ